MKNISQFTEWLRNVHDMKRKSSNDVVSRCRRIEKIFNIDLDDYVYDSKKVARLTERLRTEYHTYLKPETNRHYAVTVIIRALNLYTEYCTLKHI